MEVEKGLMAGGSWRFCRDWRQVTGLELAVEGRPSQGACLHVCTVILDHGGNSQSRARMCHRHHHHHRPVIIHNIMVTPERR
jgi:hypothetical protein